MIEFHCPKCGKQYELREEQAGKKARCGKCKTVMQVPTPVVPIEEEPPDPFAEMLEGMAKGAPAAPAQPIPLSLQLPPAPFPTATATVRTPAPQVRRARSYDSSPNVGMSFIGAVLGAGVGSAIWIGIGYATGYEIGWIAVLVGVLAGLGGVALGGEHSSSVGTICALAGLGGIIAGSYGNYYFAIHSDKAKKELMPLVEKKLMEDAAYQKMAPDRRKQAAEEFIDRELIPRITYFDAMGDSPKDIGFLILFGILGLVYGYRYGSGSNQES